MEVGLNGKTQWCPLEYEFLPNFCYICGMLGHVDRECSRGSWKEKKKPFGPELQVWPSRLRSLEDSRNRNSRSSGSGGQNLESDFTTPTRKEWIVGSDSGSGKSAKGSVNTGEDPTSPQTQKSPLRQLEGANKPSWSDEIPVRDLRKMRVGDRSADKKSGDLVEKGSLSVTDRTGLNEGEQIVVKGITSLGREGKATLQSTETDPKEQEMEVDDFSLNSPSNHPFTEETQTTENKKKRTVKKEKRTDQKIVETINHNFVKKRSCDEMEKENQMTKRQRLEVMWRDEEGDVVQVESDLNLDEAGLPEQSCPTK